MSSDEGSSPMMSEGQGWDEFALCNAAGSSGTSATAACGVASHASWAR